MSPTNPEVIRAFDRARDYDRHATIQRRVADALAARVAALDLPPAPDLLEIGCGTGFLARALLGRGIGGHWLLTDIAPSMLDRCATALGPIETIAYAVLDGEAPALPQASFDLIVSSFTFQWFSNLPGALNRLAGLLRPGGMLAFASMAEGSFAEWNTAHRAALGSDAAMASYPSLAKFEAMVPAGLTGRFESERLSEHHPDARSFLHALRGIGAHRPREPQPPLRAPELRRAMAAFDASGATISYEVVYGLLRRGKG